MGLDSERFKELLPAIRSLVPRYFESRLADMKTIGDAIATSDFDTVKMLAHRMKGNGASYGFPELGLIAKDMETFATEKNAAASLKSLQEMKAFLEKVRPDIAS